MILRGPPAPPPRHPTLAHALARAPRATRPASPSWTCTSARRASRGREVRARAERAAAALAALGVEPGDRVAIVLRTEPAFLDAFFGAWLAGAVPVPLYPPVRLGRMDEYVAATGRMIAVAGARLVVSGGGTRRLLGAAVERARPPLGCRDAAELARGPGPHRAGRRAGGARARAVLLRIDGGPEAGRAHPRGARRAGGPARRRDVAGAGGRPRLVAAALPRHGAHRALLGAMSYPGPLVLIPPEHFLARPALWLRAIARHRGTISAAPSFAYAYAADRVARRGAGGPVARELAARARRRRAGLRGGDAPLRRRASRRTASTRAPSSPCTASPRPRSRSPSRRRAGRSRGAASIRSGSRATGSSRRATGRWSPSGRPSPGVEVEVRDDGGAPAGEGRLGRIFVRGPSLMREYLGDPAATAAALAGRLARHGRPRLRRRRRAVRPRPREGRRHRARREPRAGRVRGGARGRPRAAARLRGRARVRAGAAGEGEALLVLAERRRASDGAPDDAALEAAARRAILDRTGHRAAHACGSSRRGRCRAPRPGKLRRQEALRRFVGRDARAAAPGDALRLALDAARSQLAYRRARRRGGGDQDASPRRGGGGRRPGRARLRRVRRAARPRRPRARAARGSARQGVRGGAPARRRPRPRAARRSSRGSPPPERAALRGDPLDRRGGAARRGSRCRRRAASRSGAPRSPRRSSRGARGGRGGGAGGARRPPPARGATRSSPRGRSARSRRACSSPRTGSTRRRAGARGSRCRRGRPARYGIRRHFAVAPWSDDVEVHFGERAEAYVWPAGPARVGVAFLYEPGAAGDPRRLLARFPAVARRVAGAAEASAPRGAGPFDAGRPRPRRRSARPPRRRGRVRGRDHRRGALARVRLRGRPRRAPARKRSSAARAWTRSAPTRPPGAAASGRTPPGRALLARGRAAPPRRRSSPSPRPRPARSSASSPPRSARAAVGPPSSPHVELRSVRARACRG